jgi:3D (Asp-Asp-Asp) domain-containing protein
MPIRLMLIASVAVIYSLASVAYHYKVHYDIAVAAGDTISKKLEQTIVELEDALEDNSKARRLLSTVFGRDMSSFSLASTTVTVTAYSATESETDDTPDLTADMSNSRIGLIAVSRDMLSYLDYGQVVVLPPYGIFRVSDTMNPRFTHRVDILHSSKRSAKLFGRHDGKKIIWVF